MHQTTSVIVKENCLTALNTSQSRRQMTWSPGTKSHFYLLDATWFKILFLVDSTNIILPSISLSLSEDDQNNDTLSIKPPQPQAGAYLDVKHKKRREHGSSFSSSGHRDGSKNLKRTKGVRDERKEGIKVEEKERRQSHDSKHDDRRGSKHEDLRERLDRERRSRKSKDVDVDYESSQKRIHEHKSSRSRRERSSSKTDSMDTGGAKILESKEHYGHKENFKRKKHSDIVLRGSSPEEEARSKSLDPDEDIHHMKDLKYSNVVLEDQSDEGILIPYFQKIRFQRNIAQSINLVSFWQVKQVVHPNRQPLTTTSP